MILNILRALLLSLLPALVLGQECTVKAGQTGETRTIVVRPVVQRASSWNFGINANRGLILTSVETRWCCEGHTQSLEFYYCSAGVSLASDRSLYVQSTTNTRQIVLGTRAAPVIYNAAARTLSFQTGSPLVFHAGEGQFLLNDPIIMRVPNSRLSQAFNVVALGSSISNTTVTAPSPTSLAPVATGACAAKPDQVGETRTFIIRSVVNSVRAWNVGVNANRGLVLTDRETRWCCEGLSMSMGYYWCAYGVSLAADRSLYLQNTTNTNQIYLGTRPFALIYIEPARYLTFDPWNSTVFHVGSGKFLLNEPIVLRRINKRLSQAFQLEDLGSNFNNQSVSVVPTGTSVPPVPSGICAPRLDQVGETRTVIIRSVVNSARAWNLGVSASKGLILGNQETRWCCEGHTVVGGSYWCKYGVSLGTDRTQYLQNSTNTNQIFLGTVPFPVIYMESPGYLTFDPTNATVFHIGAGKFLLNDPIILRTINRRLSQVFAVEVLGSTFNNVVRSSVISSTTTSSSGSIPTSSSTGSSSSVSVSVVSSVSSSSSLGASSSRSSSSTSSTSSSSTAAVSSLSSSSVSSTQVVSSSTTTSAQTTVASSSTTSSVQTTVVSSSSSSAQTTVVSSSSSSSIASLASSSSISSSRSSSSSAESSSSSFSQAFSSSSRSSTSTTSSSSSVTSSSPVTTSSASSSSQTTTTSSTSSSTKA